VQTVSSSVIYSSGSNVFGNSLANTQTFTGSMYVTGSTLNISSSGNMGLFGQFPRTPSAVKTLESTNWVLEDNGAYGVKNNAYYNGTNNVYIGATTAERLYISNGLHYYDSPSSSSGAPVNFTERFTISNGGNVAIGLVGNNATSRFEVNGGSLNSNSSVYSIGISTGLTTGRFGSYQANSVSAISTYYDFTAVEISAGSSAGYVSGISMNGGNNTTNGNTVILYSASTERMRITSTGTIISQGGNIVLGSNNNASYSSTSAYTLFIANAGSEGSVAQGQIAFGEVTGYGINTTRIGAAITTAYSDTYSRLDLVFKTKSTADNAAPVERMRITSAGDLAFLGSNITWGYENQGIKLSKSGVGPKISLWALSQYLYLGYAESGGWERVYAQATSGGVYLTNGATSWTANSDERLKNINSNIENAVDKLSTLRTVNYSWKSDELNRKYLGLIAQDVQKVLPELIDKDEKDEIGTLGVRYTEMIPVLVKAIQEQQTLIAALQEKLERNNIN
jgi:hypothetical protein